MIDASDFQRTVEAYGADARNWPADRRVAMQAFQAAEPDQAAAILAFEAELDGVLDILRPPVVSKELRDRILAAAPKQRRDDGWAGLLDWFRPGVGAAMAASCAAGAVAGLLLVHPPQTAPAAGQDLFAAVAAPGDSVADDDSELG